MKEYLSPGAYLQENNQSFLPVAPVSNDSVAVFIGGFTKGQAFIPMLIKDTNDLLERTGQPNGDFYSQYAALEYSKHKGNFWVQRLLWEEGYTSSAYGIVGISAGGITGDVLSLLGPCNADASLTLIQTASINTSSGVFTDNLMFYTTGSNGKSEYTLSATNVYNIVDNFGTEPYQPTKDFYLINNYSDLTTFSGSGYVSVSIVNLSAPFINHTDQTYNHATTPWISNLQGDRLFKIHHISDGDYTNKDIKIAIQGVNTSSTLTYTKFDIIVRQYSDTDKKPVVLQNYYEVDLNPTSDNFIAKKIGDMYYTYDSTNNKLRLLGDFPNVSKYIRVEISQNVRTKNVAKMGVPYRVDRIPAPYSSSLVEWDYPTLDYTTGTYPTRKNYLHAGYDTDKNSITALSCPSGISSSTSLWSSSVTYDTFSINYIVPLYGGFDGKNPTSGFLTNDTTLMGFDLTSNSSNGYNAYIKALDIIKNVQEFDIDVISIAGINLEGVGKKAVFDYALQNVCQWRGDCIVVADTSEDDEMNYILASEKTEDYDSSFGAVYYPAVKIKDTYTKTYPIIPASTYIPAVIAYTQLISQPHYAPAGISRGTLNVLQAVSKLNKTERDQLYKFNVNPIATFAGAGTVVWGQKTLAKTPSALDRLNVRILINRIKKWIQKYGKNVLFDNNTVTLRQVFTLGVQNYLSSIVSANGLYAYKFLMDQSNNTPDVIDRNQLVGQVWLKPTKASQFIIIPINIVRSDSEL